MQTEQFELTQGIIIYKCATPQHKGHIDLKQQQNVGLKVKSQYRKKQGWMNGCLTE